MRGAGLIEKQ